MPLLKRLRESLPGIIGPKAECEGNHHFDPSVCKIGWHGDLERRRVIGVRFGHDLKLCYQWYINHAPFGTMFSTTLHHGDLYPLTGE